MLPPGLQAPAPTFREFFANDFSAGYDPSRSRFEGKLDYSPNSNNVDWVEGGGFRLRPSMSLFSPTLLPADICLLGYYEINSLRWLVAALADGSLWVSSGPGAPFTSILNPGGPPKTSLLQYNNRLYFQNGSTPPGFWDGTKVTYLGHEWNTSAVGSPAPVGGNMPTGKYMAFYGGHMHILHMLEGVGTVGGPATHPNRIRQSLAILNRKGEQDYREGDYFDLDSGSDSETIVGAANAGQKLFILRQHSLFQFSGSDYTEYRATPISSDRGASGPHAFVVLRDALWAWDSEHGLHATSGYNSDSGSIQRDIVTGGLVSLLKKGWFINPETVALTADRDRVLVSSDTLIGRRTYAYDTSQQNWAPYSMELGPSCSWAPNDTGSVTAVALWRADDKRRVVRVDGTKGYDSVGLGEEPIPATVLTPWYTDQRPTRYKLVDRVTAVMKSSRGQASMVDVHADWDDVVSVASVDVEGPPRPGPDFVLPTGDVIATATEKRYPGALSTPAPCTPVPDGTDLLVPTDGVTFSSQRRLRLRPLRAIALRLHAPYPAEGWAVHGVGFSYSMDARRN